MDSFIELRSQDVIKDCSERSGHANNTVVEVYAWKSEISTIFCCLQSRHVWLLKCVTITGEDFLRSTMKVDYDFWLANEMIKLDLQS